eukprot:13877726-Ditylum_brightwellii.AAC.1
MGQRMELVADDFYTWGCLVFVLDAALQNSRGIGPAKWDPWSEAGVYLGCVCPQYHIVFDDEFTTTNTTPHLGSDMALPNWTDLIKNHTESATEEAFNIASS